MGTAQLEAVSDYLLDLYSRAGDAEPDDYCTFALSGFARLLGVDKAWWGLMTHADGVPQALSTYSWGLPAHYETAWEAIRRDDTVASSIISACNQTVCLDEVTIPRDSGLKGFAEEFDLRHTLCVGVRLPDHRAFMFISTYRTRNQSRFSRRDQSVNGMLAPHMHAAWRLNMHERLRSRLANGEQTVRRAFVDRLGGIVRCEDGFREDVAKHWKTWRGAGLPRPLAAAVDRSCLTDGGWQGERGWAVKAMPAGLLTLVQFRLASPLDCLGPREREVATLFAGGRTYKEIARETNLRPATVRYYVREVYAKLLVNNKASLAALLCSGNDGRT